MVDRRIRKTKKEIENALMELVEQQDFEQISVTDIADKADISRRTFYQHYVDKYDLLAKLEDGLVKDYLVILGNIDLEEISIDKRDNMVLIFDFINQNRDLIKMIIKIRNPELIQELLKQSRNFY
jgi:Transcriptional regulator